MKYTLIIRFWYWVYRWSEKLKDYAENTADSRGERQLKKIDDEQTTSSTIV